MRTKIEKALDKLLANAGDTVLRRRAKELVLGLELKNGDKVLDVGCGNGYYPYLLARLPVEIKITGIDSEKAAIDDARIFTGSKKIKFVLGSAYKLPFKVNSFDKVLMSEVLEHLENPVDVLKELRRVVKPGGIVAITTVNKNYPFLWDPINWILERAFNYHIKSGFWAGIWNQHDHLYSESELINELDESGLKVVQVKTVGGWCLPFNHYLLNAAAKLMYDGHLPKDMSDSINKFKNREKPLWIRSIFILVNLVDSMNDRFPIKPGVSFVAISKK